MDSVDGTWIRMNIVVYVSIIVKHPGGTSQFDGDASAL